MLTVTAHQLTAPYSHVGKYKTHQKIMQHTQYTVTTVKHVNGTGSNSTVVKSDWSEIITHKTLNQQTTLCNWYRCK